MERKNPVFVKIEEYRDLVDILNLVRDKMKRARFLMDRVDHIKKQEDSQIGALNNELSEIERKLSKIDSSLFKSEVL